MSFINECSTIIRRSSKEMFNFCSQKSLYYNYFDMNGDLVFSNNIINKSLNFTDYYFTLDFNDDIYGIYKDDSLKMFEISNKNNKFSTYDVLTYDNNNFDVLFPSVKKLNNTTHIFYYVMSNNSSNTCALFHHYNDGTSWVENKIDFIDFIVLNNYVVSWTLDSPTIFFLNLVNGYEEVFFSRFVKDSLTWTNPVQITNSNKNKVYLSILKDDMNFYHISFCENIDNGYSIKYINGYITDKSFSLISSTYVTGPSACMFPSFIKHSSTLYIMWVNFNRLNTSYSNDLGKTWSEHEIDEFSVEEDFTRALFFSNYKEDISYSVSSVFTSINDIAILGF